jgi:hypothetical protein
MDDRIRYTFLDAPLLEKKGKTIGGREGDVMAPATLLGSETAASLAKVLRALNKVYGRGGFSRRGLCDWLVEHWTGASRLTRHSASLLVNNLQRIGCIVAMNKTDTKKEPWEFDPGLAWGVATQASLFDSGWKQMSLEGLFSQHKDRVNVKQVLWACVPDLRAIFVYYGAHLATSPNASWMPCELVVRLAEECHLCPAEECKKHLAAIFKHTAFDAEAPVNPLHLAELALRAALAIPNSTVVSAVSDNDPAVKLERLLMQTVIPSCPAQTDFLDVVRLAMQSSRLEQLLNKLGKDLYELFQTHATSGALSVSALCDLTAPWAQAWGLTQRQVAVAAALSMELGGAAHTIIRLRYPSMVESLCRLSCLMEQQQSKLPAFRKTRELDSDAEFGEDVLISEHELSGVCRSVSTCLPMLWVQGRPPTRDKPPTPSVRHGGFGAMQAILAASAVADRLRG